MLTSAVMNPGSAGAAPSGSRSGATFVSSSTRVLPAVVPAELALAKKAPAATAAMATTATGITRRVKRMHNLALRSICGASTDSSAGKPEARVRTTACQGQAIGHRQYQD